MSLSKREKNHQEIQDVLTLIGLGIVLLHEIEDLFAKSVLMGLNEKDRRRGLTYAELLEKRKKMTFGQLVTQFKKEWEPDHIFESFLDGFVESRNLFAHRLTALDGHDITKKRGRTKVKQKVERFLNMAFIMKRMMLGSYYVSAELSLQLTEQLLGKKLPNVDLSPRAREDCDWFVAVTKYRGPKNESS